MPQLLNSKSDETVDFIVKDFVEENVPSFSVESWEKELDKNGINVASLAFLYADSLRDAKPAVRLRAINDLMTQMGATKKEVAPMNLTPNFVVNGENVQILAMLAPSRTEK